MKTAEQIASEVVQEHGGNGAAAFANIIRAIEADRAQRFEVPEPLAGVIHPTRGGVFVNAEGDYLVEPVGSSVLSESPELILACSDGTTATIRGEWSTGWEA